MTEEERHILFDVVGGLIVVIQRLGLDETSIEVLKHLHRDLEALAEVEG